MAKSNRRKKIIVTGKKRKKLMKEYIAGGGKSKYARKKAYCNKNGVWGWEVKAPKPWGA